MRTGSNPKRFSPAVKAAGRARQISYGAIAGCGRNGRKARGSRRDDLLNGELLDEKSSLSCATLQRRCRVSCKTPT